MDKESGELILGIKIDYHEGLRLTDSFDAWLMVLSDLDNWSLYSKRSVNRLLEIIAIL